jgi:divalent metal cation (Fe/Co/Zn/Cd) transporter
MGIDDTLCHPHGNKTADLSYTYGYAKVERIASLTEIILLYAVAGWIFYEGIERIFFKTVQPEITVYSFAIMFVYIAVDLEDQGHYTQLQENTVVRP